MTLLKQVKSRIKSWFIVLKIDVMSINENWQVKVISGDSLTLCNDDDSKPVLEIKIVRVWYKPSIKVIINPYKFEKKP
jgi:hypothetical protein